MLGDMDHLFWLTLVGPHGWTDEMMAMASATTWQVIGGLAARQVFPLKRFQYLLMVLRHLSMDRRLQICRALYRCKPEHLEPGVARPVRSVHATAEDLAGDASLQADLELIAKASPSQNILCEDYFGRSNCYNQQSHGAMLKPTTLCTRHVLPEAMAWHRIQMGDLHARTWQPPVAVTSCARERTYRAGNLAYVAIGRQEGRGSIVELNLAWGRLSEREKRGYDQYVSTEAVPLAAPDIVRADALGQGRSFEQRAVNASIAGIGTSQYPLNVALVAEGTRDIDAAVREWTEMIGELFSEDDGGLQAPSCKQCADKYGFGHCVDDFSAVEVASFSGLEAHFVAMSRRPGRVIGARTVLNLFSITWEAPPAGHADVPEPTEKIYLFLKSLYNPVAFCVLQCNSTISPVDNGAVVNFPPNVTSTLYEKHQCIYI